MIGFSRRVAALLAVSMSSTALFALFASSLARALRTSIDEIFQRDAGTAQSAFAEWRRASQSPTE